MISDEEAVRLATESLISNGATPKDGSIACLFACALLETGFGYYWKGAGIGSFNQGAIQTGSKWTGQYFEYKDSHPNADGTSTLYSTRFRKYPRELIGWSDLVRVMYTSSRVPVRVAAEAEDWLGVSLAMYNTHYYEGFGKTPAERVSNHDKIMRRGINRCLAVLNQNPTIDPGKPTIQIPRTIRFGDVGSDVKLAQYNLQVVADGIFGKVSVAETQKYQTIHGLDPDGIIGPATWTVLLTDDFIPVVD